MEIIIGVVVVFFILILIGKLKGAPAPETMTEIAIFQRLQTEGAWISSYLRKPYSIQQNESLKRMYDAKTTYVQSLKNELTKRQMTQVAKEIHKEITPILQRAAEIKTQGIPEADAHAAALKEWHDKNNHQPIEPLQREPVFISKNDELSKNGFTAETAHRLLSSASFFTKGPPSEAEDIGNHIGATVFLGKSENPINLIKDLLSSTRIEPQLYGLCALYFFDKEIFSKECKKFGACHTAVSIRDGKVSTYPPSAKSVVFGPETKPTQPSRLHATGSGFPIFNGKLPQHFEYLYNIKNIKVP